MQIDLTASTTPPSSASTRRLLTLSAWLALATGLLELAILAGDKWLLGKTLFVGRDVVWLATAGMARDPAELDDLAGRPSSEAVLRARRAELHDLTRAP